MLDQDDPAVILLGMDTRHCAEGHSPLRRVRLPAVGVTLSGALLLAARLESGLGEAGYDPAGFAMNSALISDAWLSASRGMRGCG